MQEETEPDGARGQDAAVDGKVAPAVVRPDGGAPGIRPSTTSWSNLAGEIPMYIAASSRDRPRRGTGRVSERARAMGTDLNAD